MKKGFISAAVAGLALAVLIIGISASITSTSLSKKSIDSIQASTVAERADDAQNFFAETFDDAIVDSGWVSCGCNASSPSTFGSQLVSKTGTYFTTSAGLLSADGITVSASPLASASTFSSCNATGTVNASFTLNVSSSHAKVLRPVALSRTLVMSKTSTFMTFNITPTSAIGTPKLITVSC